MPARSHSWSGPAGSRPSCEVGREPGAALAAGGREFLVNKLRDHENEIRGQLRPFGLKVGQVSAAASPGAFVSWSAGILSSSCASAACWLRGCRMMARLSVLHGELLEGHGNDELCRALHGHSRRRSGNGVGLQNGRRRSGTLRRSSDVGAHLGLRRRQYQSGEDDDADASAESGDGLPEPPCSRPPT